MRITQLTGIAAALISIAPIGASAQSSRAGKSQPKPAVVRSDVRELPADQQIIQALSRLTFGAKPGDRPTLTEAEIADVVTFLKTLTDGYMAPGAPAKKG